MGFKGSQCRRTGAQQGLQGQLHVSQVKLLGPEKDWLLLLLPQSLPRGLRTAALPSNMDSLQIDKLVPQKNPKTTQSYFSHFQLHTSLPHGQLSRWTSSSREKLHLPSSPHSQVSNFPKRHLGGQRPSWKVTLQRGSRLLHGEWEALREREYWVL